MKFAWHCTDLLQILEGEPLSFGFSTYGSWISASAVPHGGEGDKPCCKLTWLLTCVVSTMYTRVPIHHLALALNIWVFFFFLLWFWIQTIGQCSGIFVTVIIICLKFLRGLHSHSPSKPSFLCLFRCRNVVMLDWLRSKLHYSMSCVMIYVLCSIADCIIKGLFTTALGCSGLEHTICWVL